MFIRITIRKGGYQVQMIAAERENTEWETDGIGSLRHGIGLLKEVKRHP